MRLQTACWVASMADRPILYCRSNVALSTCRRQDAAAVGLPRQLDGTGRLGRGIQRAVGLSLKIPPGR